MKLSLAARVTAAFLLVVFVLTFGSVAMVALSLRKSLEEGLARDMEQDISSWRGLLEQEERVLAAAARGIVTRTVVRSVFEGSGAEAAALQDIAGEQRALLGVDLLLLIDSSGKVRAGSFTGTMPAVPPVEELRGRTGLLLAEDIPYWSVSTPVEVGGRLVGYLFLGIRLDEGPVQRFQEQHGTEMMLLMGRSVNARGLHSVKPQDVLPVLPSSGNFRRFLMLGGVRVLAAQVEVGEGLRLVLVRRAEEDYARFHATQMGLVGLGAACALIAGAVAFLMARRVTEPLRQLTAATARVVAEGDFRGTLEVNSRDEIGELATSFQQMMQRLRDVLLALRAASAQLESAATQLSHEASEQNRTATRQVAALYETQVTAQELQRSSQAAALRAQTILQVAEQADSLGSAGEHSLESSVGGLTHIREQVDQIARTSQELQQRTAQIGGITQTVKDLADQSNMLALNAAIEAVRSGEHGKGFGVVAREIRSLADQSAEATGRVQEILTDISRAIAATVHTSESGAREVEGGLAQVRATGESLRALATLIHDNGLAVREIAETVSQQDAGIAQIFEALRDLSMLSQETVTRLTATEQAASKLSLASREVGSIVGQYKL
ncbi:Methyl-accepting chemotaxis protein [Stigmatella aurantiaca]|uniref:Methyl-accepting chemotaxis protein n=1 Tax=Stigmatella aurantiaca TaxID=41 RepID=A0A1H7FYJ1_STIAU|nr:methyl-accepting chemotaxis protein [Stigmatella aurantiaca]SEK31126.1 Methyl-accepting chemotaxis protein [Stigmatella aurantiaca]